MNRTWVAVAFMTLGLAACGDEQSNATTAPSSQFGAEGTQTPPGSASQASGNKASENTSDAVSTQRQLDPVPEQNKPGGMAGNGGK